MSSEFKEGDIVVMVDSEKSIFFKDEICSGDKNDEHVLEALRRESIKGMKVVIGRVEEGLVDINKGYTTSLYNLNGDIIESEYIWLLHGFKKPHRNQEVF